MAKRSPSPNLINSLAQVTLAALLLLITCFSSLAQTPPTLLKKVAITSPFSVSVDRYQRILVADEKGNVSQFDSTGTLLNLYSPPKVGAITSIEAWKTVQVFLFYREYQQYAFLDRFLRPLEQYDIDRERIGFARLATLGSDDNLWMVDDTDFSLKKYDPHRQTLLINTPLSLVLDAQQYDLNFIREYQNLLFINDRESGILVFDNLGNYKKKLPFQGLNFFGVWNDEVYGVKNKQLHFFHLYNLTERVIELPAELATVWQVVMVGSRLVVFTEKEMRIYGLN